LKTIIKVNIVEVIVDISASIVHYQHLEVAKDCIVEKTERISSKRERNPVTGVGNSDS